MVKIDFDESLAMIAALWMLSNHFGPDLNVSVPINWIKVTFTETHGLQMMNP